MHQHDREHAELDAAEATKRKDPDGPDMHMMQAAVAGRHDVLGASGLLGVQRAAGNDAAASVVNDEEGSSVHDVISGSGQPLDDRVRTDMEARMGHNFSDVRVHTDDAADRSARSVSAHAYTAGSNIVFQRGAYDPGSTAGKTMLAHELTHVVQQRNGPVDGTPVGGGVSVSDPSDRFEREASANAERVTSQPTPAAAAPGHGVVQRQDAPVEAEELQALHEGSPGSVQRQEEPEEVDELPA